MRKPRKPRGPRDPRNKLPPWFHRRLSDEALKALPPEARLRLLVLLVKELARRKEMWELGILPEECRVGRLGKVPKPLADSWPD